MTQPCFMVHQGSQSREVLEGYLRQMSQRDVRVGASVFLPRYKKSTSREILLAFGQYASCTLADPETHKLDWDFPDRGRGRHDLAYLQESDPVANRKRFLEDVLSAQIEVGASIIVSPWLTHGESLSTRNLRATLRFAEETLASPVVSGRDVVLGFAATQAVITDEDARNDLIDAIVELDPGDIYFRLQLTGGSSYSQFRELAPLLGLRNLVSALGQNGRRTLLPQSGLVGWLMLPFGASCFGAGVSASTQRFVSPQPGFGTQPLEWYFLPQLLGFVLRQELPAISRVAAFARCECPFCETLGNDAGAWSPNEAGLHYLWWCSLLANEAATAERPVEAVKQRVDGAIAFRDVLDAEGVQLDKRSEPVHLEAWSRVIRAS